MRIKHRLILSQLRLHRLEAVRTLGETTIQAFVVAARLH